jgi:hypothetical protein
MAVHKEDISCESMVILGATISIASDGLATTVLMMALVLAAAVIQQPTECSALLAETVAAQERTNIGMDIFTSPVTTMILVGH